METSQLKQARLDANLSIEEVSRKLNIRKHYIVAIEENKLHEIPSLVYARGYIKMYALLLGIQVEPISLEFTQEIISKQTTSFFSKKVKLSIIFCIGVSVILCLWFYMINFSATTNTLGVIDHLENLEPTNHLLNIQKTENTLQNPEDMLQSIPPINGRTNELDE